MVTTNDKIIIDGSRTENTKKNTFDSKDTSLLSWWKKVTYTQKWCSHKWRHTYKNDQKISFDP